MKRLLFVILLLVLNFTLKAQGFPLTQNLASDSTLVRIGANSKGAIRGSLIPSTYTDTTTANAGRIDDYPFAIIGTSGDGKTWMRNYLATGWVQLSGGTSPSGSFWNVGGNLLPVYPTPYARIGTLTPYGGALSFITNSVDQLVIPNGGIVRSSAAINKYLMMDTSTKEMYYGDANGVGTVTSVGLTMPSAFSVANSPVTGSGTLAVTGAGTTSQYIRGDGSLATYSGGSTPQYINIILSGQSNAWGASGPTAHDTTLNSRVLIWNHAQTTPAWVTATINQRPFRCDGYNSVDGGNARSDLNGSSNSAFYLAKKLADENPLDTVRIIMAIGDGSSITNWFNGVTKGRYTDSITVRGDASGINHTDLFIWCQGESDAATSNATYTASFDSIKATLRREPWFSPTTHIVVSGLPVMSATPSFYQKDSLLQTMDYDSDVWSTYGLTTGLTIANDDVHYSGGSLDTLGTIRYYQAWKASPYRNIEKSNSLAGGGSGWGLTGNSGTTVGTNFVGTTDDKGLMFKTNGVQSGYIDRPDFNTSFGVSSMVGKTTATYNSAFGLEALYSITDGTQNSGFGVHALRGNTTGDYNSGFGVQSLYSNQSGLNNTAVGWQSLFTTTNGSYNTAVGYEALNKLGAATSNTAVGYQALKNQTTASSNTAVGVQAGLGVTTSTGVTAIGSNALAAASGAYNSAVGGDAMLNTTGTQNTSIGFQSMKTNTSGNENTAVGFQALYSNSTSAKSTAVGWLSLFSSTGANNTSIGYKAGHDNSTGTQNTYLGYNTGLGITTGSYNTVVGSNVTGLTAGLDSNIILANGRGNTRLQFSAPGKLTLSTYGAGSFTGTPAYVLNVDLSGNVIENAVSSYTPTLYNTTNVAASTAYTTFYEIVGGMVNVWGEVDIDATAATTLSELGMDIPVGGTFTVSRELAGTASFEDNTSVLIKGSTTNNRAIFKFTPQTDTNNKYSFHFTYKYIAP